MFLSFCYTVVLIIITVIAILLTDVYSRDASYWRQSDIYDNRNYNKKNGTTAWPALGSGSDNIANTPTWVRPSIRENSVLSWQKQRQNHNLNVGTTSGYNHRSSVISLTPSSNDTTDDELKEFSETLLRKDVNNAGNFVTINLQGKTTSRSNKDEAPLPLLTIDKEAFKIPSVEKMLQLYNNYVIESNVNEHYTSQEKQEENTLLDTIIPTSVMQHTKNFLIQKGKIGRDRKEFKDILREIWFNMYARGGGRIGSSGFEHVFLAEIKNNQISGLHNWLYFDEEERNNHANYLGYMKKVDLGNKGAILKYHFTFHGIDKPVGSMFIGTSPEFEIALYTTCFLLKADKSCPLKLNGNNFVIRTFTYRYRGKNMIGSAFPDI